MKSGNSLQLKSNVMDEKPFRQQVVDDKFGWIIVFGSFFIFFISAGTVYSSGIMYTYFLDEFKESKGYTYSVLSLMIGLASLTAPIVSILVKKYGCRSIEIAGSLLCAVSFFASAFATNVFTLMITMGLGAGFGLGLIFLPPIVIVSTYFEKYRALATGISLAGSGLGTFVMVPLVAFLCDTYGWRTTMMILSSVILNCGIFGILYRPFLSTPKNLSPENFEAWQRKQSKELESQQNFYSKQMEISSSKNDSKQNFKSFTDMMNLSLLKDPIFIMFNVANFASSLGYYVPYLCLADMASMIGISSENASRLLSVIGIVNTAGRIIIGYLSDRPWINRLWLFNSCLIICGTATALSFLCFDFKTLSIYAALFGFTSGAYIALKSVILVDLFGLNKLESAYGLVMFIEGIANFIGPIIVGYLYDQSQSYTPGFLFAGGVIVYSGVTLFGISALQNCIERRELRFKTDHIKKNIVLL